MNHSIKFPLPFEIHLGFVIFSVIMMILCYKRRKYAYELYMLIGIASTLLIYIAEPKPVFYALALEEVLLLIMTVADMIIVARRNAAAEKALNGSGEILAAPDMAAADNVNLEQPAEQTEFVSENAVDEILVSYGNVGDDVDEPVPEAPAEEDGEILNPYEPEQEEAADVRETVSEVSSEEDGEIFNPYEPEQEEAADVRETVSEVSSEEDGEILNPYEPEEEVAADVRETVSEVSSEEDGEILNPYEPEEEVAADVSETVPEDLEEELEEDIPQEAYIPAHAVDESAYMPKHVKVIRRAKEPEKPPERNVSYDVDSLLAQFEEQRDSRSYDTADLNMPTLDEILAEHRRKKGGRKGL